jgi:GNAT superfamily N-acetyltransferase
MTKGASPPCRVRVAEMSDAPEIAHLTTELGYPASEQEISSRLAGLLPLANHFVAVAEVMDGQLLGWVAAERRLLLHYEARAELVGLVVRPDARRLGLGRALVAAAEQWAVRQGWNAIFVRSNVARSESHPFYERLGYRRNKTQHSYLKEFAGTEHSS